MTNEERQAIAEHIERVWRSRTPSTNVMDALAMQRVLYTDVLAAFPHLDAFGREEVTPIHNRVMRRLRKEFPNERWS